MKVAENKRKTHEELFNDSPKEQQTFRDDLQNLERQDSIKRVVVKKPKDSGSIPSVKKESNNANAIVS